MSSIEAKGKVYYGMHFYPGCAEYAEPDSEPFRVFLNENTIRHMGPSFTGCPVFVYHVNEVEKDIDKLKKKADGWVYESFFNEKDGKHWVRFIVVSKEAEQAIKNGMRLSNCYVAQSYGEGGTWNGISYDKEVLRGEYDHLAIVPNPRYEESIILDTEEFKKYNEDKSIELKRLANDRNNHLGDSRMKFNIFKRAKVENSSDISGMSVELPKSKVEVSLEKLINEADEVELKKDKPKMAVMSHLVEFADEKISVEDLIEKTQNAMDDLEEMKKKNKKSKSKNEDDMDGDDGEDSDDDGFENEEDEEEEEQEKDSDKKDPKEKKMNKKKKKNSKDQDEDEEEEDEDHKHKNRRNNEIEEARRKKELARLKAEKIKNANLSAGGEDFEDSYISTSLSQVNRGKQLLGSGKF
jgi:hypothetical protein